MLIENMKNAGFIVLLLFVISCESRKSELGPNEKELKINYVGEKQFPLDETSTNIFFSSQLFKYNGKAKFAFFNQPDREIKVYDYESEILEASLKFEAEGPFGVGRVGRFLFLNYDSLLVFDYTPQSIYYLNHKDSLYNRLNFLSTEDVGLRGAIPRLPQGQNPVISGGSLILTTPNNVIPVTVDGPEVLKDNNRKIITELDKNGSKRLWGNYPKNYNSLIQNQLYYDTYITKMIDKDSLLLSFPLTDSVYIYDNQRNFISSKRVGDFFDKVKLENPSSNKFENVLNGLMYQRLINDNYSILLVDPYRKTYLRFIELKKTDNEIEQVINNRYLRDNKRFKIAIFDESFNYIGTILLPINYQYNFYNTYITDEGIFIFNINKNQEYENKIIFDHFQFVDL